MLPATSKRPAFLFDKSLPLGRAKRACLCARLLAIFSAHRRTALLTMCFSSMCFGFYGKVRETYGGSCSFVHVSARLCTFPHISAHFCASPCYPSSKKPDSRRTRYSPCLSILHTFPENTFHLSGYTVTISIQTGYILNFQPVVFQPMSATS